MPINSMYSCPQLRCTRYQPSPSQWQEAFAQGQRRYHPPESVLFTQGDLRTEVFLLLRGRLLLASQAGEKIRATIGIIGEGVFLGANLSAALTPCPMQGTAVTDLEVHHWSTDDFERVLDGIPIFARGCLEQLSCTAMILLHRFINLSCSQATGRVAWALLHQQQLTRDPIVSVDRAHIASMTGLTHFTVSRVMAELKQNTIIRAGSGWYQIVDEDALLQMLALPEPLLLLQRRSASSPDPDPPARRDS